MVRTEANSSQDTEPLSTTKENRKSDEGAIELQGRFIFFHSGVGEFNCGVSLRHSVRSVDFTDLTELIRGLANFRRDWR